MTMKKLLLLAVFLVACLGSTNAFAKSISAEDRATARALYNNAVEAYDQGKYTEALEYWSNAYELTEATILLYSIGNAHERLGNLDEAISALQGYKASVKDPEENEILDMRIVNLQERLRAQREAEELRQAALERERADAEARENSLRTEQERLEAQLLEERLRDLQRDPKGLVAMRWTTIGLAGAAAITGGVFQLKAKGGRDTLSVECSRVGDEYLCPGGARQDLSVHDRDLKVAYISYAVAGGLGLIGASLLFVHPNKNRTLDELALEPVFYGDGGGMSLRARF